MKKIIVLLMTISAILNMTSCKKDVEPDIDNQPNSNFRILKVEQTIALNTPPFLNYGGRYTVEYSYSNDTITTTIYNERGGPLQRTPRYIFKDGQRFICNFRQGLFHFMNFANAIVGQNDSRINIENNRISSMEDEILVNLIYDITGKIRHSKFSYSGNYLKEINAFIVNEAKGFFQEDSIDPSFNLKVNSWSGNLISSYSCIDYISPFIGGRTEVPPISDTKVGRDLEYLFMYENYNGNLPEELVRRVNQALMGIAKGPMEDYIFNWQLDILKNDNNDFFKNWPDVEQNYFSEILSSNPKYVLADWIWSFAHPSFNVLPKQDKIITSKRMVGKKMVDIINGEPVYQDIDSTVTFPYTHDPVAKTLEIAGLKIWYEVVDK
jgi:hypothetical protein